MIVLFYVIIEESICLEREIPAYKNDRFILNESFGARMFVMKGKTLKNQLQKVVVTKRQIISEQEKRRKEYEKAKLNQNVLFYKKVKYQGIEYEIGEYVEISNYEKEKKPIVAQLTAIIVIEKQTPFIEVEWTMRKEDISKEVFGVYYKHISEAEVFLTGKKYYLGINAIVRKCLMMGVKKYGEQSIIEDNVYFFRSSFIKGELFPPPKEWKADCICKMPTNPDFKYVQCPVCEEWFHETCVKIVEKFICSECKIREI